MRCWPSAQRTSDARIFLLATQPHALPGIAQEPNQPSSTIATTSRPHRQKPREFTYSSDSVSSRYCNSPWLAVSTRQQLHTRLAIPRQLRTGHLVHPTAQQTTHLHQPRTRQTATNALLRTGKLRYDKQSDCPILELRFSHAKRDIVALIHDLLLRACWPLFRKFSLRDTNNHGRSHKQRNNVEA